MSGLIGRALREGWSFFRYLLVGMAWGIPFAFTAMIENADGFPLHPHLAGMLAPWNTVFVTSSGLMSLLGILLVASLTREPRRLDISSAIGAIGAVMIFIIVCILAVYYAFIVGLLALLITGVISTLSALTKRGWVISAIFVVVWATFSCLVWEAAQWKPRMADWSTPGPGIMLLGGIMEVAGFSFGGTLIAFCQRGGEAGAARS